MDNPQGEERARATVEAFWAAYEAASPEFFDFFTADAAIFSVSSPTRLAGGEAYRRHFGNELLSQKRAVQILHPEVHLVGEGALVTQHVRIRVNYRSMDNRLTFLLVPDTRGLKIAHMHMSPLGSSSPSETAGLMEDVLAIPR